MDDNYFFSTLSSSVRGPLGLHVYKANLVSSNCYLHDNKGRLFTSSQSLQSHNLDRVLSFSSVLANLPTCFLTNIDTNLHNIVGFHIMSIVNLLHETNYVTSKMFHFKCLLRISIQCDWSEYENHPCNIFSDTFQFNCHLNIWYLFTPMFPLTSANWWTLVGLRDTYTLIP